MKKHLCRYEIVKQTPSGLVEVCSICKKKLVTKKGPKGKIDNKKYLYEHKRDFLQPGDKDYDKEWGNKKRI